MCRPPEAGGRRHRADLQEPHGKSLTARELFKALPALRKELWGGALWTSSYFAATVGQFGGYESVKRYVEEQGQTPEDLNLWLEFAPPEEK